MYIICYSTEEIIHMGIRFFLKMFKNLSRNPSDLSQGEREGAMFIPLLPRAFWVMSQSQS